MKKTIDDLEDIKTLVDLFYEKVRADPLLKDIFNEKIQDRWPEHLDKMYRFWQTVLFNEHAYKGSPFSPHSELPVEREHFDRWIALFCSTLDENFEGEKAKAAQDQAMRMAEMFHHKIQYLKNNS